MVTSGIYEIVNNVTGKRYIGSTVNLGMRRSSHFSGLRRGDHKNAHLQNAWNKHGECSFEFRVILECDTDGLLDLEQRYIDAYEWDSLYNLSPTAGSTSGVKYSEDACAKISEVQAGRVCSEETRSRMSKAQTGRKHSEETRAKMSRSQAGRDFSEETKAKMSAAKLGKKHSDSTRKNMSMAKLGNKNAVGNQNWLGRTHSEETKKRISAAKKGKTLSGERREVLAQIGNSDFEKSQGLVP
jgi:group I intron endonuclease